MKVSKPIILYLPDLIINELDKHLQDQSPTYKYNRIYFYYVIHYIVSTKLRRPKEEFVYLNLNYLKSITTSNIDRYITFLKKYDIIISDNNYKIGIKSLKYKLNEEFVTGVTGIEIELNSKLSKKIIKKLRLSKTNYYKLDAHLKLMLNKFKEIDFDYSGAYKWIKLNANENQALSYLTSINHIEDKRFRYFKRNTTNKRLDTNLTNLKSELKQFIKGDYVSIDLNNSQPFFLGVLIENILKEAFFLKQDNNINNNNRYITLCSYFLFDNLSSSFGIKEFERILKCHKKTVFSKNMTLSFFLNSTKTGNLYEEFMSAYSEEITRKEAKSIMFKVLFSRNKFYSGYKKIIPYSKEKQIFESVFPFVSEVVKILKEKDHRKLPIYLQKLESYIFIDCIAKELVNNGIIPFTIHDSVIVERKHQEQTIDIMNKVFAEQIGVIPTFEIKSLKQININDP